MPAKSYSSAFGEDRRMANVGNLTLPKMIWEISTTPPSLWSPDMFWQLWLRILPFLTAHSALFGIRLLLSPVSSNIVLRTACCVVGIGYPVYSTFKAIEKNNNENQAQLLTYWAVYGCFLFAEVFSDMLISWIPLYYHMKLGFLIWLQLPSTNGSKEIYDKQLRPFLLRHEPKLDKIENGAFKEINKFLAKHRREVHFVKGLLEKLFMGVYQVLKDIVQSSQPWGMSETMMPDSG